MTADDDYLSGLREFNLIARALLEHTRQTQSGVASIITAAPSLDAATVLTSLSPEFAGGPFADNARALAEQLSWLGVLLTTAADALERRREQVVAGIGRSN